MRFLKMMHSNICSLITSLIIFLYFIMVAIDPVVVAATSVTHAGDRN